LDRYKWIGDEENSQFPHTMIYEEQVLMKQIYQALFRQLGTVLQEKLPIYAHHMNNSPQNTLNASHVLMTMDSPVT